MAEYISRETALNVVDFWASSREQNIQLTAAVNAVPAADVVEVVRCGECAWWQDRWAVQTELGKWHYCANVDISTPKDFYCAFGEKMQESEFANGINVGDKMDESEGEDE